MKICLDNELVSASDNGNLTKVMFLIKLGANVNAYEALCLFYAAVEEHSEVCKYLISKGASIQLACSFKKHGYADEDITIEYLKKLKETMDNAK